VRAAREVWFEGQPDLDPARLIFIDETCLNTKMARLRGRCRRGERLFASIPHGHWNTTTFVAGLSLGGLGAPMLIEGAMNGDAFLAYVEQVLIPELKPGDIVVIPLDDASHRLPGNGTISASTRAWQSARRLRQRARNCGSCRRIHPISIRSNWPSQSSSPCSVSMQNALSKTFGNASVYFSTNFPKSNVLITSNTADTSKDQFWMCSNVA
jgi:hypothetical protein